MHHLLQSAAPISSSSSSPSSRHPFPSSNTATTTATSARSRAASAPVTVSVSAISAVPVLHHHYQHQHQHYQQLQTSHQEKPKKPPTQPPMSRRPSTGASTFALVTPLHTHLEHNSDALDQQPPSPVKQPHPAKESLVALSSYRLASSAFHHHSHHHPLGFDQHQEFHLAREHQPLAAPATASTAVTTLAASAPARPDMPRIDSGVGSFATLASLSSTSSLSLSLSSCSTNDTAIVSPKLGANARAAASVAAIPEATANEEESDKGRDADDERDDHYDDDDGDDKFHDARSALGLGLLGSSSLMPGKRTKHLDYSNSPPPQLPTPSLNCDDLFAEFHLAHSSSSPMHSLTHHKSPATSSSSTSSLLDALADLDHAPPTPQLAPASSTHHLVDSAATSLTSSPASASSTAQGSDDNAAGASQPPALVLPPLHAHNHHPRGVGGSGAGLTELHVRPRADREADIGNDSLSTSLAGFDVDIDDQACVSSSDSDSESDGEHRVMLRAYTTHAPVPTSTAHLQPQPQPQTRSSRSSSMSSTTSRKSHTSSLAQSIFDVALNFTGFAGLRARASSTSKPSAGASSTGSTAGSSPRAPGPAASGDGLSLHVAQAVLAASEAAAAAESKSASAAGLPGLFARLGLGGGSAAESKAPSLAHSRSDTCTSFGLLTSDFMPAPASAAATAPATVAEQHVAASAVTEFEPPRAVGSGKMTAAVAAAQATQAGSGVPVPPSPTRALLRSACNDWDAHLATYIDPIFAHLRALETRYRPKRHYMDTLQTAISREMRDNLVDYLVGVRVDLSLSRDSVFLAVNYLDRFLSKRVVTSTTLDSVCLAALLVSTKYEEVAPPDVLDLTRLLEGQFTPDDLLDMERELLTTLGFKLNAATIESFLPLAMAAAGLVNPDPVATIHVEHVAWMAIADYDVTHVHLPSVLAGASVLVAAEVFGAGGAVAHAAGAAAHRAVVTHEQADKMWDGVCKWLGQEAARELTGAVSGVRRALRKPRMNIQRCTELALRAAAKAVEA